jgi:regulator of cell morphogenesis and NO signaling
MGRAWVSAQKEDRLVTPLEIAAATESLSDLAVRHAGASRVFHRHRLDFCCHGNVSLADACARKGLVLADVVAELTRETREPEPAERWERQPLPALIDHVLERFHARHRTELVRLRQMANRVEQVHAQKETCPRGLEARLEHTALELESHMQKEENVLFPILAEGRGALAGTPIRVMEREHLDHARNLEALRELTHDFTPPPDACGTWKALYLGLAEFEREVMEHIHLENHVLFPRALRG